MRYVCTDNAPRPIRFPICEYHAVLERRRPLSHGDRMMNRSNGLLDRPSVKNIRRMKDLSHRLCYAPMMDRKDSHSKSIGWIAVCAQRVHEGTAIDFARVRCNAIVDSLVRRTQKRRYGSLDS